VSSYDDGQASKDRRVRFCNIRSRWQTVHVVNRRVAMHAHMAAGRNCMSLRFPDVRFPCSFKEPRAVLYPLSRCEKGAPCEVLYMQTTHHANIPDLKACETGLLSCEAPRIGSKGSLPTWNKLGARVYMPPVIFLSAVSNAWQRSRQSHSERL